MRRCVLKVGAVGDENGGEVKAVVQQGRRRRCG